MGQCTTREKGKGSLVGGLEKEMQKHMKKSGKDLKFDWEPTDNFETFQAYLQHLNKELKKHMPFLRAKFGITTISIMVALKEGGILTDSLKRKYFDKNLSKTTVLV